MKKVTIIILSFILIVTICSCSNTKSKLSNYITNYNEVVQILEEKFNSKIKIEDNDAMLKSNEEAKLKQFGNGNFYLKVNEIDVRIYCQEHEAFFVFIDDGRNTRVDTNAYKLYMQKILESHKSVEIINGQAETIKNSDT